MGVIADAKRNQENAKIADEYKARLQQEAEQRLQQRAMDEGYQKAVADYLSRPMNRGWADIATDGLAGFWGSSMGNVNSSGSLYHASRNPVVTPETEALRQSIAVEAARRAMM